MASQARRASQAMGPWESPRRQGGGTKSPPSFGRRNLQHAVCSSLRASEVSGHDAKRSPEMPEDRVITWHEFRSRRFCWWLLLFLCHHWGPRVRHDDMRPPWPPATFASESRHSFGFPGSIQSRFSWLKPQAVVPLCCRSASKTGK